MEEWCQETFGKLLEAKARNDNKLRRTGNMGEIIIGGCLIEKRQRELSHMGGVGGLCTYIEKLVAEWPLLVLMVYQLRSGNQFVRRKIEGRG
jgi:hypothetical protein